MCHYDHHFLEEATGRKNCTDSGVLDTKLAKKICIRELIWINLFRGIYLCYRSNLLLLLCVCVCVQLKYVLAHWLYSKCFFLTLTAVTYHYAFLKGPCFQPEMVHVSLPCYVDVSEHVRSSAHTRSLFFFKSMQERKNCCS